MIENWTKKLVKICKNITNLFKIWKHAEKYVSSPENTMKKNKKKILK